MAKNWLAVGKQAEEDIVSEQCMWNLMEIKKGGSIMALSFVFIPCLLPLPEIRYQTHHHKRDKEHYHNYCLYY
jgi:hypothetical protein